MATVYVFVFEYIQAKISTNRIDADPRAWQCAVVASPAAAVSIILT